MPCWRGSPSTWLTQGYHHQADRLHPASSGQVLRADGNWCYNMWCQSCHLCHKFHHQEDASCCPTKVGKVGNATWTPVPFWNLNSFSQRANGLQLSQSIFLFFLPNTPARTSTFVILSWTLPRHMAKLIKTLAGPKLYILRLVYVDPFIM
jgi:hypothetical protein